MGRGYFVHVYQSVPSGPADDGEHDIHHRVPAELLRTSDDPAMGQSYEKQYQALRLGAISEENRRKFNESAWSSMSTPVSATPVR